jgi:large subunit ribosomal protein L17
MRHRKRKKIFNNCRTLGHRKAMVRALVSSLFLHRKIRTTVARAREVKRIADRLISLAKQPTVHTRRQVFETLPDRSLIKSLFTEMAPEFKHRQGGYTRLIRILPRPGDGAEMAVLELTESIVPKPPKGKKHKLAEKKPLLKEEIKPEKKKVEPEKKKEKPKGFLRSLRKYFKTSR